MYELTIEGTGCSCNRCPDPEGTPLEVAVQLLETRLYKTKNLPDSTPVVLSTTRWEEYLPPRCRKPRTRTVYDEVARFTLGELRPLAAARERARTEALAAQAAR
jgi:hypothetical protein